MKVRFWGTRGSIAVPGAATVRYGGNTSCVQVTTGDTQIILDCGTGVRELGRHLMAEKKRPIEGHILLSHTHWDHIQGFPFFIPVQVPGNHFLVYSARGYERALQDILAAQMDYTYFPIKMAQLQSPVEFRELDEETFEIGHVEVTSHFMNHTTLTMGYRIVSGGRTVVYATDTEPFGSYGHKSGGPQNHHGHGAFLHEGDLGLVGFARDADVLIHDAQYTEDEYPQKIGWGHSTVDYALEIALAANVSHLVLFHHDISRSDEQVAALEAYAKQKAAERGSGLRVSAAAEGQEIDLAERDERRVLHSSSAPRALPKKYRLLFADDDPSVVALVREVFSDDHLYEVHDARDGETAVRMALEVKPDLILLDVIMPKLNGVEAARELRRHEALKKVPIILITGQAAEELGLEGFGLGMIDFMRKPFALAQLRARVQMWLTRKEQPEAATSIPA